MVPGCVYRPAFAEAQWYMGWLYYGGVGVITVIEDFRVQTTETEGLRSPKGSGY